MFAVRLANPESITIADDGGTNHFEVTLFSDGKIKFQYKVSRTTIAEAFGSTSQTAKVVRTGGDGNYYSGDTGWHSDCGIEWKQKTLVPCLKIAFYLDPLTAETGAARVIPGSYHMKDTYMSALHGHLQVAGFGDHMDVGTPEENLGMASGVYLLMTW